MNTLKLNKTIKHYPLSSPQREIWFDQILHEDVPLYNIGGYVKIPGQINPTLFEQAINLLVQKHDALRTVLTDVKDEDGMPLQTFIETLSVSLPVQDFSKHDDADQAALPWMQARFNEPFKLFDHPLFRYDLIKTSYNCYYWLMQYHHLIADGYSVALLHRSLANIYTQLVHGKRVESESPSYTHYINDDRAYVATDKFEQQRRYWLAQYPTAPESLLNPHYRSQNRMSAGCEALYMPRHLYQQLEQLAKQQQATLLSVLLGTLYVYFTRTAQRDELPLGLPVLNRSNAQFKQTAGLFVGVSPALLPLKQDLSFVDVIKQIQKILKANYRAQRFPISELNREILLDKTGRSSLFDINFSYQRFDYDTKFNEITSHFTVLWQTWTQTPLIIHVQDFHQQSDIKLDFVYNLTYFTQSEIQALQSRFIMILQTVLTDPSVLICNLPLLTDSEIQQLQTWNLTETDYPKDKTIIELFEEQVEKTPENIAIVFEEQKLSYQALNTKANQLAHYLMKLGVKAETLVGICVERSLEMVISLLGILKAGGAYVPLDPDYPKERLQFMLEDSDIPVLLSQSHLQESLPVYQAKVIYLDRENLETEDGENPARQSDPENLAYVIYTSGSTGVPKGVMVTHNGFFNLAIFQKTLFNVTTESHIMQFVSLSFDATCWKLAMRIPHSAEFHLTIADKLFP